MGEPRDEISAAAEPDEEIELSAVDLVALAEPGEIMTQDPAAQPVTAAPLDTLTPSHAPMNARSADTRSIVPAIPRSAIFAGLAFVATAAGVAVFTHTPSESDTVVQDTWKPPFPQPVAETDSVEPPPQPQGPPVRYANPFDPNEVFEFPPGTSRATAREQVAEVLRQRAIERLKSARK